jgi:Glycosyl hydrolase catalytic core
MVDWAGLQPRRNRAPNLDGVDNGCLRDIGPCGEFAGMRDVLRAVRSQQEANGGWDVLVTLYGVPEWAARPPGGCERSTEQPRSRPMKPAAYAGYRALVRAVLDLAEEEGVELRWWSPWNEPNQPYFISPQRARCDVRSPSLSVGVYTRIVRALQAELRAAGGERRLVLGDLAGVNQPSPLVTGVKEFVEALPREIACAGDVWAQHMYAERGEQSGLEGAVGQLRRTLNGRRCTRGKPIWVTETGVGGTRVGAPRTYDPIELRGDCRAMATALRRWARDRRVDAAFQYTFREDTAFPVGLADPGLSRTYPVYDLWRNAGEGRLSCGR